MLSSPSSKPSSTLVRASTLSLAALPFLAILCLATMPPTMPPLASAATATTTTLAITANSLVAPQTILTLTATVTSGGTPVHPGQVTFCDAAVPFCTDIHALGTAQLLANGTASLRFVTSLGIHSYKAVFLGTKTFSGSVSPTQPLNVPSDPSAPASNPASPTDIPALLQSNVTAHVLGASNLTLTPGASYPTGQLPNTTVAADFNGDGILDLAVTVFDSLGTYVPGTLAIFLGKGDGTFTPGQSIVTDIFPFALVTADFNGDGKLDLAFADGTDGSISIYLGNGDGTFTQSVTISGSFADNSILAVGDFNEDGVEDLVVSQARSTGIRVLLGHGDGTFAQVPQIPATGNNPLGLAVGDYNADGHLDVAVCNESVAPGSSAPSTVTILLGKGNGTFTPAPPIPVGIAPESILTADFNGDGKLDLAVLNIGIPTTISMLFGNGDGTFDSSSQPIPLPYLAWFTLGDFNHDAKPDIGGFLEVYQPTNVNQNVYALINNGDGTFQSITASDSLIPQNGVAGDFNGDGLSDLAVVGEYGGLSIYLTTVNGTSIPVTTTTLTCNPSVLSVNNFSLFSVTVSSASGTPTGSINFTDNGAALTQSTLVNGATSYNFTARQQGTRTILATYVPTGAFAPSSASCVLTVSGFPTTATLSASPTATAQGSPVTLTVSVSGGPPGFRGSPVGPVTFYNGSTIIASGLNLAQGTVSFTTTTLPPGIDYLTCTYNGNSSFAPANCNTVAVTITQSSAAITLASSLNPAPALTPITFTAQVAPGSSGTIVFNINGQTITTTPDASGQATTTTSTLTPGSYLITATYFASASALAAQASLNQLVTVPVAAPDFSLTGTNTTFVINHKGTGKLLLASLGTFSGAVALTCNPPYPPGYTCTLQTSNVSLPLGFSAYVTYTLSPTYAASIEPTTRSTRLALAAVFPLSLFALIGLARKRRTAMRALLCLVALTTLASITTACGPDHFIPITTGTYPLTFTGVGTSQNSPTPITHTVTVQATIAP